MPLRHPRRLDPTSVVVKPKAVCRESWWIGLSREAFAAKVAARETERQSEQPRGVVFSSKGLLLDEVMP